MTITSEDRKSYQRKVGEFRRQEAEDTCLSRSIENILGELSDRHDVPRLRMSHSEIKDLCDYKQDWGCDSKLLPEVLTSEIGELGYICRVEKGFGMENLDEKVEQNHTSYPIVELSPEYLHDQEEYDVQAGMHGQALPHTVVVFSVNDENIQFFDPYEDFYTPPKTGGAPPSVIPKSRFLHYWSGPDEYQWTLWVQRQQQTTITQATLQASEDQ